MASSIGQNTPDLFKPSTDNSARLIRGTNEMKAFASSIKTLTPQSDTTSERSDGDVNKASAFWDSFATKSDSTAVARQDYNKQTLEHVKGLSQKAQNYAKQQIQQASHTAQAAAAYYIAQETKEFGLDYLRDKEADKAENQEQVQKGENLKNILANPDKLPFIMKEVVSRNISEARKKALELGDKDEVGRLDEMEAKLNPIFNALTALDGNGSHEELVGVFDKMVKENPASVDPQMKKLIVDYQKSLVKIADAQKRFVGLSLQAETDFIHKAGIDPKTDRKEFQRVYARLGGIVADRNGGIRGLGGIFNYSEANIPSFANPFEHKDGSTDLLIRRLLPDSIATAQNRVFAYVGLNENNPSPGYVYVDSDVPLPNGIPFDQASS